MMEENIREEVELVQKMILEYFQEECKTFITQEHIDLIKVIFQRTKAMYADIEVKGRAIHDSKEIKIKQTLFLNVERVISYLLHEYAHMFIERDYDKNKILLDKTFSEGMCDTFSDLVMNYYFNKHKEVMCKGRVLVVNLPYDSYSVYKFQNGWVRTVLYPLEKVGRDKEAIVEMLLGSPIRFFELTLGKEFSDNIPVNQNGFPTSINLTYRTLYMHNKEAYHNIDKKSIYYRRNQILPAFIIQEKIENTQETPIYDLGNRYYNEVFIEKIYFASKKIYEIPNLELKEFIELYNQSKTPEKTFIKGLPEFLDCKMKELTEEEISIYSYIILQNILEILEGFIPPYHIGDKLEYIVLSCLKNELIKIEQTSNPENLQNLYNLLYPNYLSVLQKGCDKCKNIYETIVNLEPFIQSKITNIEIISSERK